MNNHSERFLFFELSEISNQFGMFIYNLQINYVKYLLIHLLYISSLILELLTKPLSFTLHNKTKKVNIRIVIYLTSHKFCYLT